MHDFATVFKTHESDDIVDIVLEINTVNSKWNM